MAAQNAPRRMRPPNSRSARARTGYAHSPGARTYNNCALALPPPARSQPPACSVRAARRSSLPPFCDRRYAESPKLSVKLTADSCGGKLLQRPRSGRQVEPAHAGHLAAGSTDAGNRRSDRLKGDRHVERIGVNEGRFVAHDRDMPVPEQKIAATQLGMRRERAAERLLLHVTVARAGNPASIQRHLHEPGAIEAERGLPAPQIWRANETLGDRDEIVFRLLERSKMPCRHVAARSRDRKRRLDAHDGKPRSERQRLEWRQLDRGAGKHERAQRRDLVRGGRARLPQRARRQEAHIAVGLELAARPAFLGLVDDDALTPERLGIERCVGGGRLAQWCGRLGDLEDFSHSATPTARRARAPLGTLRLPVVRAWWPGSRRRCRNAATLRRR